MEDSIFTKIINGEVPSYKIYEDSDVIAILDINPMRRGHTLVIPKVQVEQYLDLDDTTYQALWGSVKKIGLNLRDKLAVQRVAVKVTGTDVPHVHIHLVPFNENNEPHHDSSSPSLSEKEFTQLADALRLA